MVNVFFSLIHFWTLLPWWIFYTSADLLLFVLLSTIKSTTMWPHHSHNIFGLPLFLWHCTFPSSINFFNGWFRLHVRTNLFCLFNKVPDLTTAIIWIGLLYVLSMILKIFPDIIYFQMHLCVSPCFCSGSTFHVHVAVEHMHVHNALLNFVICCLP